MCYQSCRLYTIFSSVDSEEHLEIYDHLTFVTTWSLWKESLKSDGEQFHQYQQNEHYMTSQFKQLNTKINETYDVGNGLGQAKICGSVKPPISVRVNSSWSMCGTRLVTLGNNPVINHKKKGRNCDHGNRNIYVVICVIDSP